MCSVSYYIENTLTLVLNLFFTLQLQTQLNTIRQKIFISNLIIWKSIHEGTISYNKLINYHYVLMNIFTKEYLFIVQTSFVWLKRCMEIIFLASIFLSIDKIDVIIFIKKYYWCRNQSVV